MSENNNDIEARAKQRSNIKQEIENNLEVEEDIEFVRKVVKTLNRIDMNKKYIKQMVQEGKYTEDHVKQLVLQNDIPANCFNDMLNSSLQDLFADMGLF